MRAGRQRAHDEDVIEHVEGGLAPRHHHGLGAGLDLCGFCDRSRGAFSNPSENRTNRTRLYYAMIRHPLA